MNIYNPFWLLFCLPLVAAMFAWPLPGRRLCVLRSLCLGAIILALAGLTAKLPRRQGTLILVADRSDSMPAGTDTAITEMATMLRSEMDDNQNFGLVTFGARSKIEAFPGGAWSGKLEKELSSGQSNLNQAIDTALALIPDDSSGRILVASDGNWTGSNPNQAAGKAVLRKIPLDFRLLERPPLPETSIAKLSAPAEVATGESFLIHAWIQSDTAQQLTYKLTRDNTVIANGKQTISSGKNRLAFRDRLTTPGAASYLLQVESEGKDPVPQNNHARFIVGVAGQLPILLVSKTPGGSLQKLLDNSSTRCVHRTPEACTWSLTELADYSAVILENVRADTIGADGMALLAEWVETTGRGLMFTGGKHAYGTGGYFGSPLERIMPVSMELRQEDRKLSMALVVVLDRSGSMTASVAGGKTKMDLANIGTVQVLDLLSDMDEFGVIAVDSAPHTILPIQEIPSARSARGKLLSIESMGGGIYVYEALKAATAMVASSSRATRHVILFSDAADTEQPGKYIELLGKCRKAGMTVSVIALGTAGDPDAALCEDIARRGGGNIYFTNDATQIPRLFAQDTFAVARSTFVDEPSQIKLLPTLSTITGGLRFSGTVKIGGFNLCYARENSLTGAVTTDEFEAPFIAWWQAGAGRVLCQMGEVDGKYTGPIGQWSHYSSLVTSLAGWTTGRHSLLPENSVLTQKLDHGTCRVDFHLDPNAPRTFAGHVPKLNILREKGNRGPGQKPVSFEWSSVNSLTATIPLTGTEVIQIIVDMGNGTQPVSLPPVCLPYSPEFADSSFNSGADTLHTLASATGGKERISLKNIQKEIPSSQTYVSLVPWLCGLAALLFILEIFDRRVGFAVLRRPQTISVSPPASPTVNPQKTSPPPPGKTSPAFPAKEKPPEPSTLPTGNALSNALKKADNRAKHRLKR